MSNQGLSIIIPCLNEEQAIGAVIDAAHDGAEKLGLPFEILVVNNRSSDQTACIARKHGATVLFCHRIGYGSALRKGIRHAQYPIIIMGDGDQSYDFRALGQLVQPILAQRAELVIGNRFGGIQPGAMPPLHRWIGNPLLSWLTRLLVPGIRIRDIHCGFRAFTRDAFNCLNCVTSGMEFASEMMICAARKGIQITEIPIRYYPRVGQSKLRSFSDGWRHLRFILMHSPTPFLVIPGALLWCLSLLMVLPLAFGPVELGGRNFDIHSMTIGGMLNLISIQVLTIGLLTKAYAHFARLHEDRLVAFFYRVLTLERMLLIAGILCLAGSGIIAWITWHWAVAGFGALAKMRPLFLGLLLVVNGVQLGASAFLFSIMALPRIQPSHSDPT